MQHVVIQMARDGVTAACGTECIVRLQVVLVAIGGVSMDAREPVP